MYIYLKNNDSNIHKLFSYLSPFFLFTQVYLIKLTNLSTASFLAEYVYLIIQVRIYLIWDNFNDILVFT